MIANVRTAKAKLSELLERAAADSGRRMALRELVGQPLDHPEILSIPETGYLKAFFTRLLPS